MNVPRKVVDWVIGVFRGCNARLSEKLSNNPNTPETSLDVTFIEHLSRHASPVSFGDGWTVRIDTHFIGGRRHFYGWEIADIGVLVFYRQNGRVLRKKVALLQSKRLYPLKGVVLEESCADIMIGISTLMQGDTHGVPLSNPVRYDFSKNSKYKALKVKDEQYLAIERWNRETEIPVLYMFYNPWALPFSQQVPLEDYETPTGECELGTRVVPTARLYRVLRDRRKNYSPKIDDLRQVLPKPHTWRKNAYGRRLESFFSDLVRCELGYVFESERDPSIDRLFYRKDAMLGAAIAITIDHDE